MANATKSRLRYTGPRPRGRFTREKVIDFLRTLAWVVPLTLLVWIWAEQEQLVRTPTPVAIPVTLRTNSPDSVVRIITPADKNILAELSGPNKAVDEAMKILANPNSPERVYINIDPNTPPGIYPISSDRIGQSPIFSGRGISVVEPTPTTITYRVEKIVEANLPIQVQQDVTNLAGPAVFDPPMVRFRGPQPILNQLRTEGRLTVYANLTGRDALKTPGPHTEKAVPLVMPTTDSNVSFTPTTVTATFTVRQAEEKYVYPSIPVWVLAPPVLADRGYKVVILTNQSLANVTLLGSPEAIAQLRNGTMSPKPRAHIEVSLEDLPGGVRRTRQVSYDLPDGIRVAAGDLSRTVDFKLTPVGNGN